MISLLEYAPTAAPLANIPKCVCKSEKHKVHALGTGGVPLCGGGHQAKSVSAWQTDIGPINCASCLAIINRRAA